MSSRSKWCPIHILWNFLDDEFTDSSFVAVVAMQWCGKKSLNPTSSPLLTSSDFHNQPSQPILGLSKFPTSKTRFNFILTMLFSTWMISIGTVSLTMPFTIRSLGANYSSKFISSVLTTSNADCPLAPINTTLLPLEVNADRTPTTERKTAHQREWLNAGFEKCDNARASPSFGAIFLDRFVTALFSWESFCGDCWAGMIIAPYSLAPGSRNSSRSWIRMLHKICLSNAVICWHNLYTRISAVPEVICWEDS